MKKIIPWFLSTAIVMLALPWLAVTFIKGGGGMAACFLLFFAVNPIWAVCAGAYAGTDIKRFWGIPIAAAMLFLAGTGLFFGVGERAFILYALAYLFLGIMAMFLSMFLNRHLPGLKKNRRPPHP